MWFFHSITLKISMIEDNIWEKDPEKYIIGSDEVGRGSFASIMTGYSSHFSSFNGV